jgi:hypothetical protein
MTKSTRRTILRADALFLGLASVFGMVADLMGAFAGKGPQAPILGAAPHSAIGFVEAHGLAFLFAVLLWRAAPLRSWHFTGAAIHLLLGACNLVFWQIFPASNMLAGGYITTSLHAIFVVLQLAAAFSRDEAVGRTT